LLRFENAGLISQAERGSGGRGLGKYTEYPADVIHEYFASYHVIKSKHASQEQAAIARNTILNFCLQTDAYSWKEYEFMKQNVLIRKIAAMADVKNNVEGNEETATGKAFAEDMKKVVETPFCIEWWEYYQGSKGALDPNYIKLHEHLTWDNGSPNRFDLGDKIDSMQRLLQEVLDGLNVLSKMRKVDQDASEKSLIPLEYWIKLYSNHPEIRPLIKMGMMTSYRGISPKALDLIISGKLPEA
jgi:hypothetical protein